MIVAHLSELHLGFRSPWHRDEEFREDEDFREQDVSRAFQAAVADVIHSNPDLLLIAGDVFHRPDPPSGAVVLLARALEALRSSLPDLTVCVAAGARDTPRKWGDPGVLATFDTLPNVEAASGTARSVHVRSGETHVLILPHRSVHSAPHPKVRPDPSARWNVLLAYGETGVSHGGGAASSSGIRIDTGEWDYVALGSEHGFRQIGPRIVHSGSLERVGTDPWREAHQAKGFVLFDLEGGEAVLREVSTRPVVALAPIVWDPRRPERLNQRIAEVSREVPGGIDGKIVRLRLEGMGGGELCQLDGELLRSLRRRARLLAVEVVPPDAGRLAEARGESADEASVGPSDETPASPHDDTRSAPAPAATPGPVDAPAQATGAADEAGVSADSLAGP